MAFLPSKLVFKGTELRGGRGKPYNGKPQQRTVVYICEWKCLSSNQYGLVLEPLKGTMQCT